MIGPVSGTGRAMMASLQQAIQKGMPPDQAIQYVKSMATQGVAPLTDLYAMMNQFQRLQQQQVKPPQTPPTIRDQLNAAEQQQRMQQMAMSSGLGSMDAGVMEDPQFVGGGMVSFAGGGNVVAFQDRGLVEDIDLTKMSEEQLSALEGGSDVKLARAALGERLRRSGYMTPGALAEKYTSAVKAGIGELSGGPLIRFDNSRKFPSYMYDEESNVRQGDVTGGIAGTKYFTSSRGVPSAATLEAAAPQSAVPPAGSPYASSADAGAAFDRSLSSARSDPFGRFVAQEPRREAPATQAVPRGGVGVGAGNTFDKLIKEERDRKFQEIPDTFSGEEKKRIEKAIGGLDKDNQDSIRMALAKAGFEWAAASARTGRQRTTGFGAFAEGAIGGMQQYNAAQKELRQTERELNKEMSALRRYQDEVARGERTRKVDFEERIRDNIASLTAQKTSAALQMEQIAATRESNLARLAESKAERLGTEQYRADTLRLSQLKELLDNLNKDIQTLVFSSTEKDKQKLQTLLADKMRLNLQLEALGGGSAVPTTGITGNLIRFDTLK